MLHPHFVSSSYSLTLQQNPRLCSPAPLLLRDSATRLFYRDPSQLSRTLSRNKNLSLKCLQQEQVYEDAPRFIPRNPNELSASSNSAGRVFAAHPIYKGKSVMTLEPRTPEFTALDSGAFKISKEGFVLLQFAPAMGLRQYDWSRKQVFSLSVTEIGTLISLGAKESCEFFHDPSIGKSEEGNVKKVLRVGPLPDDSGYSFNLRVQNKQLDLDDSIYVPIARAEFTVIVSSLNYIVPHLLGWHAFANSIKPLP